MKHINRKLEVTINKITMESNPVTGIPEKKAYGVAKVFEWNPAKSIVIDKADKESGISFYVTENTYSASPLEGMDMAFLTDFEMDLISSIGHSYLYGTDEKENTVVLWNLDTIIAYQIMKNYTYESISENGHLLVFETEESATEYLKTMDPETYDIDRLIVRQVMLSARKL